jgi:hypothetical protein
MRKKGLYIRTCKWCGKFFKTPHRFGRVCVKCKVKVKERVNRNLIKSCKKPLKVMMELPFLERIAEFYGFPFAVFFSDINNLSKFKTRNDAFRNKIEAFDKIKEIIDCWEAKE